MVDLMMADPVMAIDLMADHDKDQFAAEPGGCRDCHKQAPGVVLGQPDPLLPGSRASNADLPALNSDLNALKVAWAPLAPRAPKSDSPEPQPEGLPRIEPRAMLPTKELPASMNRLILCLTMAALCAPGLPSPRFVREHLLSGRAKSSIRSTQK